jgi:hypothetical protein
MASAECESTNRSPRSIPIDGSTSSKRAPVQREYGMTSQGRNVDHEDIQ